MDKYLTFVGRGLHHELQVMIHQSLTDCEYDFHVEIVGENHPNETLRIEDLSARLERNGKKRRRPGDSLSVAAGTCRLPVGVVQLEENDKHMSLGYDEHNRAIWSIGGSSDGFVWIQITTSAPPVVMGNKLRFLGPLMALVDIRNGYDLDESKELAEVCEQIKNAHSFPCSNLSDAVNLWRRHVLECWPKLHGKSVVLSHIGKDNTAPIKYRLSCLRPDKRNYKFKRQDFLSVCAEFLIPESVAGGWTVDLKNYDLELVLFLKDDCMAMAISLRPYWHLGASDFSNGSWPPDITPPYLNGQILSQVVRLRPTTSQILLHLARLQPGDVLLDPCVGIGTIPVETQFLSRNVVALGGDLVLTPAGLAPIASDYIKQSQKILSSSSILDFLSWDACQLPFRSSIVDVVVSDLPFGQSCLSSSKLNQILPLIMNELARVLLPGAGRMVVLCGAFAPVLEALKNANESSEEDRGVWKLPCSALFPANIGGVAAWIIQVDRGTGPAPATKNYQTRMRKIVERRELISKSQNKNPKTKSKRVQS